MVPLRRRIFRQTISIEEARVTPLPTKVVKYDGIEASRYAAKAQARARDIALSNLSKNILVLYHFLT